MTAHEIAEITHAPPGYLAKVLQGLAKAGIITSQRGPTGGFRLLHNLTSVSVLDAINAVDPMLRICECPLGLEQHKDHLCSVHARIDQAMESVESSFGNTTIAELLADPGAPHPLGDPNQE